MVKDLQKEELINVDGGLIKSSALGLGIGIGSAVTFIIGLVSGWVRPYACSSAK